MHTPLACWKDASWRCFIVTSCFKHHKYKEVMSDYVESRVARLRALEILTASFCAETEKLLREIGEYEEKKKERKLKKAAQKAKEMPMSLFLRVYREN